MSRIANFQRLLAAYVTSLALILYGTTIGMLRWHWRGRQFVISVLHFYGVNPLGSWAVTCLPRISSSALISTDAVVIIECRNAEGNVTLEELAVINGLVKSVRPTRIFEIGTFDGRTALNLAYNSDDDCEIFTLDLPATWNGATQFALGNYDRALAERKECGSRIATSNLTCKNKIQQLYGDSAAFDFGPFHGTVDMVFIDAAHDYRNALNDSQTALKLIGKRKGVIFWHDYKNGCKVVDAIRTFQLQHPDLAIFHIEGTALAYCRVEKCLHRKD